MSSEGNRLGRESSPYLLLHRNNPVHWNPWGPEALERARSEDKPIFLSVGYSTCFWCHVMERESFASVDVADLMNRSFVNVKVDREERPELDEIYMTATQLLTHQGGWPNSVFLTPELKPFFAGTYFPPEDRPGMPSFSNVLRSLADAWSERRQDVEQQAGEVEQAMRRILERAYVPVEQPPPAGLAGAAAGVLEGRFDSRWGGFGGAPKFPSPANLHLLQDLADESRTAGDMLTATLDAMSRGGIFDQLAGGFHRYATDPEWKIPHFEKMLYDNGQLLEVYAKQFARTGDSETARTVRLTATFLEREMRSEDGAFYSAIDAETDGHEGAYYVWDREELVRLLGDESFGFLAPLLGFDSAPFFEGRHFVLHLPATLTEQAERRRMSFETLVEQIEPLGAQLLAARDLRDRPATDDKILTDWNGMAIAGLAEAGMALEDENLVRRAEEAAEFVLDRMYGEPGELLHSWRQGRPGVKAILSDYCFFNRGLLTLHRASGEAQWLERAIELTSRQIELFGDSQGAFYSAPDRSDLLVRCREIFDGALPSANGVACLNLLELARLTGEARWRERAAAVLQVFGGEPRLAEAAPSMALAAHRYWQSA